MPGLKENNPMDSRRTIPFPSEISVFSSLSIPHPPNIANISLVDIVGLKHYIGYYFY